MPTPSESAGRCGIRLNPMNPNPKYWFIISVSLQPNHRMNSCIVAKLVRKTLAELLIKVADESCSSSEARIGLKYFNSGIAMESSPGNTSGEVFQFGGSLPASGLIGTQPGHHLPSNRATARSSSPKGNRSDIRTSPEKDGVCAIS